MDDLDALASSRSHASGRSSTHSESNVSAFEALRWPLRMLAIVILPSLLLHALPIHGGHPAMPWVFLYLGFVTPLAAPIGLWSSAVAFNRYQNVRGRALLTCALFLALTLGWWFLLRPMVIGIFPV